MKRWSHRHQLRLIGEISVTPLLDVVLVLMLVFMLTAPLIKDAAETALLLPTAGSQTKPPAPKEVVTLSLDHDRHFQLDGRDLAGESLKEALIELATTRPEAGVLVQVDRNLPVQDLVNIMDQLRAAGISRTAVATHALRAP